MTAAISSAFGLFALLLLLLVASRNSVLARVVQGGLVLAILVLILKDEPQISGFLSSLTQASSAKGSAS